MKSFYRPCLCLIASTLLSLSASNAQPWPNTEDPEFTVAIEQAADARRQAELTSRKPDNAKLAKLTPQLQKSYTGGTLEQFALAPFVKVRTDKRMQVVIKIDTSSEPVIDQLAATGAELEVINLGLGQIQAWVSPSQFEQILDMDEVLSVRPPSYARVRAGTVTTEGDAILRSDLVRNMGISGQGVKVGIISDGAEDFTAAVPSGDLPANLTRFGSCSRRINDAANCSRATTCNEGSAMAEIIHDIAPDAQLAVAAVNTDLEFIQRLDQLANDFEADIIVDDLGFFAEPYFEDGPLAQAVSSLPANILYVSSAGNSGNSHYEANFRRRNNGSSVDLHDFGVGDANMTIRVPARGFVVPILQWATPFNNPQSDYNLFVSTGSQTLSSRANQSLPNTPPFEAICVPNLSANDANNILAIQRVTGGLERLELFVLGARAIEFSSPAGSVFGHPGVERAIAVGSINAGDPGNNELAFYSSRGPARVDFPQRSDRLKPDLAAIDGVRVTGVGGFPNQFFGTSAAAPHVAGIAALLFSAGKNVSASNVREALLGSAIDLGPVGRDALFGFGRVDALAAKQALKIGIPLPPFLLLLGDD